jgi:hypothetical protein
VKAENARAPDQQKMYNKYTASYMKRYFYLVCFQSWLKEVSASCGPTTDFLSVLMKGSFNQWLVSNPELVSIVT